MFGLLVFLALGIYLLFAAYAVHKARSYARTHGKSSQRWGWGAALVAFLIPFWDWIPTVATHQYYCATQAGFWVYKTPEQWKAENPGEMEKLVSNKAQVPVRSDGDENNRTDSYSLNQRIGLLNSRRGPMLFNRWEVETALVDKKTNEILGRSRDFYTIHKPDSGDAWKFWLHVHGCKASKDDENRYRIFLSHFEGAKE